MKKVQKDVTELFNIDVTETITVEEIMRLTTSMTRLDKQTYEDKQVLSDTRTRVELRNGITRPVKFLSSWVIVVGETRLSDATIKANKRFGKRWNRMQVQLTFKDFQRANTFFMQLKDKKRFNVIGKLTNQLPGPGEITCVQVDGVLLEEVEKL